MENRSAEFNCPYCGTQLSWQEIDFIQNGSTVKCRGCGILLTNQQFESPSEDLIDLPPTPQRSYGQEYQQPARTKNGPAVFFIGFIVFSLGLYSWIFYIPIFDLTYYGELLGLIAVIIGLNMLRKEVPNPSGVWIMVAGLLLWITAWLSWFVYIPLLSSGFIGEFSGIGLIIFGYLKSR